MDASMHFEKPFTLPDPDVELLKQQTDAANFFGIPRTSIAGGNSNFLARMRVYQLYHGVGCSLDGHCLAFLATYWCSDSSRYGRRNVGAAAAAAGAGAGERDESFKLN